MEPAVPRLRPLNLGDLLDETFSLYRRNFALFAGIVAVLQIPLAVLNMISSALTPGQFLRVGTQPNEPPSFDANALAQILIGRGIIGILGFLAGLVITGALAQAIAHRYLGRGMSVGEAYSSIGVGTFMRLLGVSILSAILVGLGLLLGIGIIVGGAVALSQVAPVLAALFVFAATGVLVFGGIYVAVRAVTFISQAIVLERTSVFGAFARTWALVEGSWWRVFGITILLALMVAIIQGAIGGVVGALLSVAHGTVARVVSTGITSVVGIVVQPVQLGGMTLLYYDLRVRREGFDLELAVSAMDAPAPE